MNPHKVLRFSLLAVLSSVLTLSAEAQVRLRLWTDKTVRQNGPNTVVFREGDFGMQLVDGVFFFGGVCSPSPIWFPPSDIPPCPLGATGYVATGMDSGIWGSPDLGSYWEVTSIIPAVAIEPFYADKIKLLAAPASTLSRPQTPFEDASFSMFYDIGVLSTDVREYRICNYAFQFDYGLVDGMGNVIPSGSEEGRMDAQIKPGIYQFSFPRLGNPDAPVGLAPRYYMIPEGYRVLRNQKLGVKFAYPNVFDADGFALINSADLKNPIKWQGITSKEAYAGFDKLYFSVKELDDPMDPNSAALSTALFPAFSSPATPTRILLKNPFVNSYVLPPVIPTLSAGNRGVLELELVRSATTNGIIYDSSSRRYQMPVFFGDHYEVFRQKNFRPGALLTGPDDDFDVDGFNNLAEWILGSLPTNARSTPKAPVPKSNATGGSTGTYYGFSIKKNLQAVPAVEYTLTRSTDGGVTYIQMVTDADWFVIETPTEIRLESRYLLRGKPAAPPFTSTHKYRIGVKLP